MSEILVNKLTGTSTAGSILVTGEGNSTTTSLQQGLAKAWASMTGAGTASVNQSLNNSSITDNGTGDYTLTNTNAFNYADYATGCGSQWRRSLYTAAQTTSTINFYTTQPDASETTLADSGSTGFSVTFTGFGDLA